MYTPLRRPLRPFIIDNTKRDKIVKIDLSLVKGLFIELFKIEDLASTDKVLYSP